MKIKRILSIILISMLVFNLSSFSALAVEQGNETAENDERHEEITAQEEGTPAVEETSVSSTESSAITINEKTAQKAYDLLIGTGILPTAPAITDEVVSRGSFAAMVTQLAGIDTSAGADSGYRDADASAGNSGAIAYVVANGWMAGDKGLFRPDDPVAFKDALKALVGMLTHSGAIKDEATSISRARSLGLLSGVKADLNAYLSGGAMCKLLVNALEADYFEEKGVSNGSSIYQKTGILMEVVHKISMVKGMVTATTKTGLRDVNAVDGIRIDNTVYKTDKNYGDLLGLEVECYIDSSDLGMICVAYVRATDRNETVDLIAEDIENLNNKETLYYYTDKESNKKQHIALSSVVPVIYNGIYSGTVNNFTSLQLTLRDFSDNPECATMRLIDNNDDGRADTVIMWQYETYVISNANADNMYYRDTKAKKSFDLTDYEDAEIVVTTNGKNGKISDIRENSVVSVAISADKALVNIYINSGILYDAVIESQDENAVEIGGVWYEKSSYYHENFSTADGERENSNVIKIGRVGTIYLDFLGRIVMGKFTSGLSYGYMTQAGKKGNLGDLFEIKLFVFDTSTKDSDFKVYPLKERFRLNGNNVKRKDVLSTELFDSEGVLIPQLVKYKISAEGEIEEIQTADTSRTLTSLNFSVDEHWYTDGNLELNYKGQAYWNSNAYLLGNKFRATADSALLIIPSDVTNEDGFTLATSTGQLFSNGDTYDVEIYDVQKSGFANLVISRVDKSVSTSYSYSRTLFVRDVRYAKNEDDEFVQKIYGYGFEAEDWLKIRTSQREYMTSDEFTLSVSYKALKHGITVENNDLKPGDVIRFNTDSKGVIQNARLEFRYSPDAPMMNYMSPTSSDSTTMDTYDEYLNGKNFGYSGAEGGAAFGKIAYHEPGGLNVGLTYDDGETMQVLKRNGSSTTPFIVFDTQEKTVQVQTKPDIRTCLYDGPDAADKAFVLGVYSKALMIVVYK